MGWVMDEGMVMEWVGNFFSSSTAFTNTLADSARENMCLSDVDVFDDGAEVIAVLNWLDISMNVCKEILNLFVVLDMLVAAVIGAYFFHCSCCGFLLSIFLAYKCPP